MNGWRWWLVTGGLLGPFGRRDLLYEGFVLGWQMQDCGGTAPRGVQL